MRTFRTLLAAGLLAGAALTTTAPAMAEPNPAPSATAPVEQPRLTADKAQVRSGNTLVMRLEHDVDGINWISSEAFVRNGEHPFGADEGVAEVINDRDGHADAVATIADVPPGEYTVQSRIGGGSGPTLKITVTE